MLGSQQVLGYFEKYLLLGVVMSPALSNCFQGQVVMSPAPKNPSAINIGRV